MKRLGAAAALAVLSLAAGSGRATVQAPLELAFDSSRDSYEAYIVDADRKNLRRLTNSPENELDPALSPDGRTVAYVSDAGGQTDLYVQPVEGGTPRCLTADAEQEGSPTWSPDGRSLAFNRGLYGVGPLYVVVAAGGALRKVSDDGTEAAWSPDGSHIAFRRLGQLFVMAADGTGERALTDPAAVFVISYAWVSPAEVRFVAHLRPDDGVARLYRVNRDGRELTLVSLAAPGKLSPDAKRVLVGLKVSAVDGGPEQQVARSGENARWSADGRQVLFVRSLGGYSQLWAIREDGTGLRRLLASASRDAMPTWSPRGDRIAFVRAGWSYPSPAAVWVAGASGRYQRRVAGPFREFALVGALTWSPDGRRIAFDVNGKIVVVPATGGKTTTIASGNTPSWSPDGRQIAFTRGADDAYAVWTMRSDGTGQRRLTRGRCSAERPTWSPDGKRIAYQLDGHVYEMRRDGSAVRRIVLGGGSGPSCHGIYSSTAIYSAFSSPTWSPAGGTLAVVGNDDWPTGIFYPPGLVQHGEHDPFDLVLVDLEGRLVRTLAARAFSPSWRRVG